MSSDADINWFAVIGLPIIGAVITAAIIYTIIVVKNTVYTIIALIVAFLVVATSIFGAVSYVHNAKAPAIPPPAPATTEDPFTYDPGESADGTIIFSGNASSLGSQYNCLSKSPNTSWINNACQCNTGYYGNMCQYQGFGSDYVSLTTVTTSTSSLLSSSTTQNLTTWPLQTTVTGCTNTCTANPNCLGVTYANTVCTQITALSFSGAPIQNVTLDPPVNASTMYLNKSRITGIKMPGYFTVIYGVLPVRYFVGNGISGTNNPVHVTDSGTRIVYYGIGVNSTIAGIPDFISVNTLGTLYISPTQIPPRVSIIPNQPTIVALPTPILLTKSQFPYTNQNQSYYVRLDGP
jgi:hypothetical protein